MTPKEKAQNLIDKFTPVARIYPDIDKEFYLTNDAKQCALIAVDEIIKALQHTDDCIINLIEISEFSCASSFYEKVKKEIEAL